MTKKQHDPDQDPLRLLETDGKPRRSLMQQPPKKLLAAMVGLALFMAVLFFLYESLGEAEGAIRLDDPEIVAPVKDVSGQHGRSCHEAEPHGFPYGHDQITSAPER